MCVCGATRIGEPSFWSSAIGPCVQAVVITDPVLATQILRSKAVDKLRFMYSFLDVVRTAKWPSAVIPYPVHILQTWTPRASLRHDGPYLRDAWDAVAGMLMMSMMVLSAA